MKTFENHLSLFKDKLIKKEPFSFSRFSDGELMILKNLETRIGDNFYQIGERIFFSAPYHPEDHKHWIPNENEDIRQKLMDSFTHKEPNYFVGLSCRCCVGQENFDLQLSWRGEDDEYLTWSNLFVNSNYPKFMNEILPLFSKYKVVYILNENADINNLPFKVEKDFRVGYNCIINDYYKIEEIKKWISDNDIEGYLFLFSASSLSNLMIHELFKFNNKNTYLDIGTTLNKLLKMKGTRDYLENGPSLKQTCIW
jgi:hypothetical protein